MKAATMLVSLPESLGRDIDAMRTLLAPAREPTIRDWLDQLYRYKATVAPPIDAYERYADGVVFALGGEPAICWTAESLRQVMLTCTHWPEVPELAAVMLPVADQLRKRVEDHDRAMSTGKVVGSRDYMHQQVAAPEPPPPLRDQVRGTGKPLSPAEAAWEDAKAVRRTAEQLTQCGGIGTELLAAVRRRHGQ